MDIKDKVVIVTGGSSGLGAATARRLVRAGGKIVLADLNAEAGTALAEELGSSARFMHTDVTDEASATACVASAQAFGALRGLINCAGIAPGEKIVGREGTHRLSSFVRAVNINLIGTFNMIRLAALAMSASSAEAEGERGVIVNTASIAAFDGQIGQAAYAASKGGIVAMTLPMARELSRYGIRVVTIAPGVMETPMMQGMPAETKETLGNMVPFPSRMGRPDEFAHLVEHILENRYLNGEVIRLDGAIRMTAK